MSLANDPQPKQVEVDLDEHSKFYAWASQHFNALTCLIEGAPAQRRGPKRYFQGSRKDFLEGYLPSYIATTKGSRQKFWHELFSAWWLRYPWGLNDEQEPPTGNLERMARLASVGPGNRAAKTVIVKRLTEVQLIFPLSMDLC